MSLFEKNLERWSKSHPKEAVMLPYVDTDSLIVCKTKKGEPNLKRKESGKFYHYHSPSDAKKEADKWFSLIPKEGVDILYVYGVGLGYGFEAAKSWLKKSPDHQLVFLEDDPGVIFRLFETELGTSLLKHPQVHLHIFKNIHESEWVFVELYWNFVMKKIEFAAHPLYKKYRLERFQELSHKLSYDASLKNALLDEYLRFGYSFFTNFYENLFLLPEASLGNAFFGKFENVPAIICGAGPSLVKNIQVLKKLQEKALIFAGSSALNAVEAEGITPHFGVGIDPNPMQYERLSQLKKIDFPFIYRNRMNPKAMKLVAGPKLYITGSGGYDVAEWFEQELGIENEFIEEGRNVVNFCLEIAHKMGCNPIIFVGMDLAYTDQKSYSPGVVSDPSIIDDNELVVRPDMNGKPVSTLWKWISEAQWISDFQKMHPEITLINATEGGIGFAPVPNQTLKSISLKQDLNLRPKIQKLIQTSKIQASSEKIEKALRDLRESLERCVLALDILIKESTQVKAKIEKTKKEVPMQTGKMILVESDVVEEAGFSAILDIFSAASSKILNPEIKKIDKKKIPEYKKTLLKIDLNLKKYAFLRDAASVNIECIQDRLLAPRS